MIIWLLICLFVLPFGLVLLYGAPYLPTRKAQANAALDMLALKEGDIFVDLGCGDGTVLIEAARRGYKCYGYELNILVFFVAKLRCLRFGSQIKIYHRNFWKVTLPPKTKGVYVFLLDKYMARLDKKLTNELSHGTSLVSYTFQIPERKSVLAQNALYLYNY